MIFRSFRKRNSSQKNTNTVYSENSSFGIVPKERTLSHSIRFFSNHYNQCNRCTVCGPVSGHKRRKHVFRTSEGLQSAEINTKSSFGIQETGVKLTCAEHYFYLSYNENGGSLGGPNFRPVGPVSGHKRSSAILHTNQATIASCYFKSFPWHNFDKTVDKFGHESFVSCFKKYFFKSA